MAASLLDLDNDAEFGSTDTLARMASAFDADTNLAALGCRIVVHATGEDDLSSWGYPAALLASSQETFETSTFVGAGHAIRRAAWDDVGGYDARLFFCWGVNIDFCLRAIGQFPGASATGAATSSIRHIKSAPSAASRGPAIDGFILVRNRFFIGRKCGHSWLALAPRMAGYCIKAARNGCLRQTPRALWAAFMMPLRVTHAPLPPVARDYLHRVDTAWRGGNLLDPGAARGAGGAYPAHGA